MFTFQSFFEWAITTSNVYEDIEEEGDIDNEYEELNDYVRLIEWCVK
jgi:hypothetical protein